MIDRGDYVTPVEMVELGKLVCGVTASVDEMVDDEVGIGLASREPILTERDLF